MDHVATDGFRNRPTWLLGVLGLMLAQTGLVLALFGQGWAWSTVTDDRPILSGRHPLHLYHGTLGATAFRERGATTCYDPQFQAGYPKTPVFDGGCRPAELFLALAGGSYRPAAYKIGLFAFLLFVPIAFVFAARGAGLPAGAAVLSGVGGILLGWSIPVRRMIVEGQLDVLAAGLAAVVFVPWLARYARTLGADAWAVLAATAVIGFYFHPLTWLGLTPIVFVHYLVFAPRHGPAWHLGLAGITFAGAAPNAWWLADWGKYWWLRQPVTGDQIPLPDCQVLLGSPTDYPVLLECLPGAATLFFGGLIGLILMWRTGRRSATWLLLLAATFTVAVARVAGAWPAIPAGVSDRIVVLAAGFFVPPSAFATWILLRQIRLAATVTTIATIGLVLAGWVDGPTRPLARTMGVAADPLAIGFTAEQRDLIAALKQHANSDARVLWDETTDHRTRWNWSALLPLQTGCSFLGGLDPEAGVEHSYCAMCSRKLTGRALIEWSDTDLMAFCRWYNVGWVVARSPATIARWDKLTLARPVAHLTEDGQPVVVYALDRPRSFVLSGTATWESADPRRVTLTNVVPNADGEVHLSLHGLEGLRASPSYIRVESMPDPTGRDPIHHVRLRMPGPVPRVTLIWENP